MRTCKSQTFNHGRLWLVIVSMLTLVINVWALDPKKSPRQYGFEVWDAKNGLSAYAIHDILQSRDGYLWLATDDGLFRFDGVRFKVYNNTNTKALRTNDISSLAEDREGNLWVGTRRSGLCKLAGGTFTLYDSIGRLPNNEVYALFVDSKNILWIGLGNAIAKYENRMLTVVLKTDVAVVSFYEDASHTLWAGESVLFRKKEWENSFTIFPPHENSLLSMTQDSAGHFWIGRVSGLYFFNGTSVLPYGPTYPVTNKAVRALYTDHDGNVWIGTEGDGLIRYANGIFTKMDTKTGLPSDRVIAICEDDNRNLWIGTRGGGLIRMKDNNLETYSSAEGLTDEYVTSVLGDKEHLLWIGTRDGGLILFKDGKMVKSYTTSDGLSDNQIRALCAGDDGTIWVGTRHGMNRLQINSGGNVTGISTFGASQGLTILNGIRFLYHDTHGRMWIGNYGKGVFLFEHGTIHEDTAFLQQHTQNSYLRAILEDRNHNMWVGTLGGLNRLRDGRWKMVTKNDGSQIKDIFCLYKDATGSIWVGTYGQGLYRVNCGPTGDTVIAFTKKDGLFDDVIFAILEDTLGNVWMSCNKGIFRIKKQELGDFAEGKISSFTSISYGTIDGMRSAECNGGSQPAAWKSVDGKLWFPTVKGLVSIDPKIAEKPEVPAPIRIEEMIVDDDTLQIDGGVTIPAGKRRYEILYTALQLTVPQKIKFQYRLDGFDDNWNTVGTRRKAYYTNIPPGEYKFIVMASTIDGIWTGQSASFSFIVLPHVWETWWFRLSMFAGLLVIAFVFVKRREVHIKREERRKNELSKQLMELESRALRAQMNPHFLFNSLNAIQECIVSDKTEAACEYLSKFAQLIRIILENSEKSLVSLERELEGLKLYLELESLRFDHEIKFNIDVEPTVDGITELIPPMLIQPYVENALWHGLAHKKGERKLDIIVRKSKDMLTYIVQDNGIGREKAAEIKNVYKQNYESKGMRVTRERLELMRAGNGDNNRIIVIDLVDATGEPVGTRVELSIPVKK